MIDEAGRREFVDCALKASEPQHVTSQNAALTAAERLRNSWADRACFLESLAGYNQDDWSACLNRAQARVLRECIGELYRAMEEAKEPPKAGS